MPINLACFFELAARLCGQIFAHLPEDIPASCPIRARSSFSSSVIFDAKQIRNKDDVPLGDKIEREAFVAMK